METKTQSHTISLNLTSADIFVLVLIPESFNQNAIGVSPETIVSGRSIEKWIEQAVNQFAYRKVDVKKTDDIVTLVKKYATEHKYTAVVYADTPLVTKGTIDNAILFARSMSHPAVRMPRGWVFETDYVKTAEADDIQPVDVAGVNNQDFVVAYCLSQVNLISTIMRGRILANHISHGVNIEDATGVNIDADVRISPGVFIEHNVTLAGSTVISPNAKILSNSRLESAQIGQGTTVNASQISGSIIGSNCTVGPWAHVRERAEIGSNCRIGNFVEIKNSGIGEGTKIAHMTYIGDAEIGRKCNIGAGVVFCNYDGSQKHKTSVGDNVFIGSNVNLIAPIILEDDSKIAAGSTITNDVAKGSLAIARARQEEKAPRPYEERAIIVPEPEEEAEDEEDDEIESGRPQLERHAPRPRTPYKPKPVSRPVIIPDATPIPDGFEEEETLVKRKAVVELIVAPDDKVQVIDKQDEDKEEVLAEPEPDDEALTEEDKALLAEAGDEVEDDGSEAVDETSYETTSELGPEPVEEGEAEREELINGEELAEDDEELKGTDDIVSYGAPPAVEEPEEEEEEQEEQDEQPGDVVGEESPIGDDDYDAPSHMPYEGNRALYEKSNRQFSFFQDGEN